MGLVSSLSCVICKRFAQSGERVEVHHIAKGTSSQNNWLVAPLCSEHHRGATGLHGPQGTRWFVRFYKVPHDTEYGLLAWVNQDISERLGLKR